MGEVSGGGPGVGREQLTGCCLPQMVVGDLWRVVDVEVQVKTALSDIRPLNHVGTAPGGPGEQGQGGRVVRLVVGDDERRADAGGLTLDLRQRLLQEGRSVPGCEHDDGPSVGLRALCGPFGILSRRGDRRPAGSHPARNAREGAV